MKTIMGRPPKAVRSSTKRSRSDAVFGLPWDDDDEDEEAPSQYVQWSSSDNTIFYPASKTKIKLPSAVYEIKQSQRGVFFQKIKAKTEGLVRFPDTTSDKVIAEITKFWEREDVFRKYNLAYKRGIMLYGPPGSGKSSTIQLVMADVIARDGVVLKFDNPFVFIEGMRILRAIQPKTPAVVVMEDIDSIIEEYSESEVLNILDGVNDVDRVVFLATTNYAGKLGGRIINRPSRFDKRFKIGFPNAAARRMYFEHIIGKDTLVASKVDLDKWVKDTQKMSIAHLKELFIAVTVLGDDYADAIKTLKSMKEDIDERDDGGDFGFASKKNSED
jgi:SpoVK/Ycf46/Vps4 family AAA+-type ATPase